MSKSTVINEKCPTCARTAKSLFDAVVGNDRINVLSCGHTIKTPLVVKKPFDDLTFADGGKPYDFQKKSMEFAREADFRCGIFHQMGLGKTIIALGILKQYIEELKPVGILCKSSLSLNWMRELIRVCGLEPKYFPYVLNDSRDRPDTKLFPITIMSLDLLRRFDSHELFAFKTLIIDECQLIKNPGAKRTQIVRNIAQNAKHVLALSGTPIKNNAAEYFTILNILNHYLFYQEAAYLDNDCIYDGKRYRGLKNPQQFKEKTKNFIIRYERHDPEVDVELPKINRMYRFVDLGDEVKKRYEEELTKFEKAFDEFEAKGEKKNSEEWQNVLAYMNMMRQITGMAKVPFIAEYAEDFFDNNPDEKLVLFMHHHSATNILYQRMKNICKDRGLPEPINLLGVSGEERYLRSKLFNDDNKYKLLIGTELASGEGLNMQSCGSCVIGERQWNPANEEQAEGRFIRIGSTHASVDSMYPIAVGTIDELFTQIVESKRKNMESTLSHKEITNWDDSDLMSELAQVLRAKGRKSLWKAA